MMNDGIEHIKLSPPWEIQVSPEVKARYGFKDGRVEIELTLPKPWSALKKHVSLILTPDQALNIKEAAIKSCDWASLPDYQRQRDGA